MTTIFTNEQVKKLEDVVKNIANITIDSGTQIGDSFKDILKKVEKMKTEPIEIPIKVKYKNWKGEVGIRTIIPMGVWYGNTDYHIEDQWLMDVWDVDKDAMRTYAMMDILEFVKGEIK